MCRLINHFVCLWNISTSLSLHLRAKGALPLTKFTCVSKANCRFNCKNIANFDLLLTVVRTQVAQKTRSEIFRFVTKFVFPRIWSKILVANAQKTPQCFFEPAYSALTKKSFDTPTPLHLHWYISLVFLQIAIQIAMLAL